MSNCQSSLRLPAVAGAERSSLPDKIACLFGRQASASFLVLAMTVLLLSSCKTTSRTSSSSTNQSREQTTTQLSRDSFRIGDELFESLTIETITETPTVVFVDGEERVFTETTTERQTAVRTSKKDSVNLRVDSVSTVARDELSTADTLSRQTEGMEVVPDIVTGLSKGFFDAVFGKTGKFIVSLILVIIAVILLRMVFRKRE